MGWGARRIDPLAWRKTGPDPRASRPGGDIAAVIALSPKLFCP